MFIKSSKCESHTCVEVDFKRSSTCVEQYCVEVNCAEDDGFVFVRDGKTDFASEADFWLRFSPQGWTAFTDWMKNENLV